MAFDTSDGEITGRSEPMPCCHELRCKSMTYRSDEYPGMVHRSNTMTYWCGETGTDDGPDRQVVDHAACQSPRPCFRTGTLVS